MGDQSSTGRRLPESLRGVSGLVALTVLLITVIVSVLITISGNAPDYVTDAGDASGVFPNRIVIGGLASVTGPLPAGFAPVFDGVTAYIDMVNADGGVNGRRIDFDYKLDDQSSPSMDSAQARSLVDQYHVFSVVGVATPSFSGATYLASHNVPTFGLNVNPNSQWRRGRPCTATRARTRTSPRRSSRPPSWPNSTTSVPPAIVSYSIAEAQQGCQTVSRHSRSTGSPSS